MIGRAGTKAARLFFAIRLRNTGFWIASILALAILGSGCGQPPSPVDTGPAAIDLVPSDYSGLKNPLGLQAASAGAAIFKTNCVSCHGEQGLGDGPASQVLDPKPANLVQLNKVAADDFLFWRINTGVDGTVMPAWKGVLTEEQIWQVVAYIRTLK